MYCKNCGNEMDELAEICVGCGVKKGEGDKFCSNCKAETSKNASVCVNCGVELKKVPTGEQKSKMVAGILGILLGGWGAHNFYLGYYGKAIAQIALTFCFGLGYIWGIIEGIMILTGSIDKDANGVPLKE